MNYLINSRHYTSVLPLSEELTFLPRQPYLFDLQKTAGENITITKEEVEKNIKKE